MKSSRTKEARGAKDAVADVRAQLDALDEMTVGQLQEKWLELYGEPTRSRNKRHLHKRLSYRIQELAEGGLSERARRQAAELSDDAEIRVMPPKEPLRQEQAEVPLKARKSSTRWPLSSDWGALAPSRSLRRSVKRYISKKAELNSSSFFEDSRLHSWSCSSVG